MLEHQISERIKFNRQPPVVLIALTFRGLSFLSYDILPFFYYLQVFFILVHIREA